MNDNTIDQAFQAFDLNKVEEIVAEKVRPLQEENEQLKSKLEGVSKVFSSQQENNWGFSAQDRDGRPAPKSWDEGAAVIAQKAKEEAKKEILTEIEKREKQRLEQQKQAFASEKKDQEKMFMSWDRAWEGLVEDGFLPSVGDDAKQKMSQGQQLTSEEVRADRGLSARLDLFNAALDYKKRTGKDPDIYRFATKQWLKDSGEEAPVYGTGGSFIPSNNSEPDYSEIHSLAKKFVR